MLDFTDRLPSKPNRVKVTKEDGTTEFLIIERADDPTVEGTPLNRAAFMALQGFHASTTERAEDGSIVQTNDATGDVLVTTKADDGSIVSTLTGFDGTTITKTTRKVDGKIVEEVS